LQEKNFIMNNHDFKTIKQLKVRYKYTKFDCKLFIRMLAENILLTCAPHADY
jgi:hypothetical protein